MSNEGKRISYTAPEGDDNDNHLDGRADRQDIKPAEPDDSPIPEERRVSFDEQESPVGAVEAGPVKVEGDQSAVLPDLSIDNKGIFSKLSENAKEIASKAYEGLYEIPVVNRIVGKMEISYNQFWLDRNEEKSLKLKSKIDSYDQKSAGLDDSKKKIEEAIASLQADKIPGFDILKLKAKEIEEQKEAIANKRDGAYSKFEGRRAKVGEYAERRDKIADKLVDHYEEQLKPIEENLESLNKSREQIKSSDAVFEARFKEQEASLQSVEDKRKMIKERCVAVGMTEKQINSEPHMRNLDEEVKRGRELIAAQRKIISERFMAINRKIIEAADKSYPYRVKRNEFLRVKARKPIEVEVGASGLEDLKHQPENSRKVDIDSQKDLESQTENGRKIDVKMGEGGRFSVDINDRTEQNPSVSEEDGAGSEANPSEEEAESKTETEAESLKRRTCEAIESTLRMPEGSYDKNLDKFQGKISLEESIHDWNEFINKKYGNKVSKNIVNIKDFVEASKSNKDLKVDAKTIAGLLKNYYKNKNIPFIEQEAESDESLSFAA